MHCAYRCPTDVPLLHVGPIVHARCNALNTLIIPIIHPEHRLVLGRGPFQPKWRTGRDHSVSVSRVNIGLVVGLTPRA